MFRKNAQGPLKQRLRLVHADAFRQQDVRKIGQRVRHEDMIGPEELFANAEAFPAHTQSLPRIGSAKQPFAAGGF